MSAIIRKVFRKLVVHQFTSAQPLTQASYSFTGADPGEVKWVNFHPPFSEFPSFFFFFSYPSNIEIIFDFSDFSDLGGECA